MTKKKRNLPCSCGSGKKYKKCCGSVGATPVTKKVAARDSKLEDSHFTRELPIIGIPGQRLYLDLLFRPADPNSPQSKEPYGGEPGSYHIIFTLSRPGSSLHKEGEVLSADQLKGDSHLAIVRPVLVDPLLPDGDRIKLGFEIPDVGNLEFTGYPNDEGYLGKIELETLAQSNFQQAQETAYYLLAPVLSYWSTYLDIPLHVYQVDVVEISTGSRQISFTNPFQATPYLLAPWVGINNAWRGYASLYREALNSNSAAYQFLCFFKILEGIRARQKRLDRSAKKVGSIAASRQAIIPSTREEQIHWLEEIFPMRRTWDSFTLETIFVPESIGKEISDPYENVSDVYNQILKPLRKNISHALFEETGELTLSVDKAFNIESITKWLPFTRCIVRRLLRAEFPAELSFKPAREIEIE